MQPRRLALLAYLAVADGGRFHRRDLVTAMFWPESDGERARHALRQTIYALRQAAGDGLVVSRGQEEFGLGENVLWCDANEFSARLKRGELESALELYQGDFLAGVHAGGAAPEFEDWVSATRTRLRNQAVTAASALAEQCRQAGDLPGAIGWHRLALRVNPLDESHYQGLISGLMQIGDVSQARSAYDELARRLERDLDSVPSPRTRALLDRPSPVPQAEAKALEEPHVDSPAPRAPHRSKPLAWGLALLVLSLAIAGFLLPRFRHRTKAQPLIAVEGFQWASGPDSTAGPILADLLSTGLARLPGVQVLSGPRLLELEEHLDRLPASARGIRAAGAAGATLLVQGQLSGVEGARRLDLRLIEVGSGRIRHTARVSAPDILALADSATNALAAYFEAPLPAVPAAAATTRSLVAYRFYEEGLRSLYSGDGSAALQLFREAVGEDSGFAMAAYYGAEVARQQSDGLVMTQMFDRVRRLAPTLPDRERLLLQTAVAMSDVDPASVSLADSLVARWPRDPDVELMRARAYAIFVADQQQAIASARRTLELDSTNPRGTMLPCRSCEAWQQLAISYLVIDDGAAAEAAARRFVASQPALPWAHGALSGILSRLGHTAEAEREAAITDSLMGRYPTPSMDVMLRSGKFADADQELERWIGSTTPSVRDDGLWWLTISLRTQGRLNEALRLQRDGITPGGRKLPPMGDRDATQLAQVLCESGAPRQGAALFAQLAAQPVAEVRHQPFHQARRSSWMLAHTATCLSLAGDTNTLGKLADSAEALARLSGSPKHLTLPHYIRGLLLRARSDWAGAQVEQRLALTLPVEGLTRINYELAGALLQLGRASEAIGPLQAGLRAPLEAGGLYLTRTELEERLAQAFEVAGWQDSARVHYASVAAAWRRADPAFKARLEVARQRSGGS